MATHEVSLFDRSVWNGKLYSNGWIYCGGDLYTIVEKATGKSLATVSSGTPNSVAKASEIAVQAQRKWVAQPFEERAAIFHEAATLIENNTHTLSEWIIRETGGIRAKAEMELQMASGILNESAAMITSPQGLLLPANTGRFSMSRRIPMGVVGVIAPFNFPLILAVRAVFPALATGNAVVLKPDPHTAASGGMLIARLLELAGLPEGLLHVLPGGPDVGEALCKDPHIDMIAFTGSTNAGRRVGQLAGKHLKKVSLELGGKNSLIVLEDADLDLAVSNAAFGAWMHQGQICMSTGRVLVHEKLASTFVKKLAEKASHLSVGNPMNDDVAIGPMVNFSQVERVHQIVLDTVKAGASVRAGGTYENLFYQPTVLDDVKPGMRAYNEELFGPVAAITTFRNEDEAVALANDTEYGLSAGIISKYSSRALAVGNQLNTGLLHINDQTVADDPSVPFGGQGASGNGRRVGGPANWDEFTQWQWVTMRDRPPQYPF